jgi:hypothetical protein
VNRLRNPKLVMAIVACAAALGLLVWRWVGGWDRAPDQDTLIKATQLQQELGTPAQGTTGPAAPAPQGNLGVDPPKGRAPGRAK